MKGLNVLAERRCHINASENTQAGGISSLSGLEDYRFRSPVIRCRRWSKPGERVEDRVVPCVPEHPHAFVVGISGIDDHAHPFVISIVKRFCNGLLPDALNLPANPRRSCSWWSHPNPTTTQTLIFVSPSMLGEFQLLSFPPAIRATEWRKQFSDKAIYVSVTGLLAHQLMFCH